MKAKARDAGDGRAIQEEPGRREAEGGGDMRQRTGNSAEEVGYRIACAVEAGARGVEPRTLQALTYLTHAKAMAEGVGMLVFERAKRTARSPGPEFETLGMERAQTIASGRWSPPGEGPLRRPSRAVEREFVVPTARALAANAPEALDEAWRGCAAQAHDERRLGAVSDGCVANDGQRVETLLDAYGAREGAPTVHASNGHAVRRTRGGTREVRLRPEDGRDVAFTGRLLAEACAAHERVALYATEGGTCVVAHAVNLGGGGWKTRSVRTAKPGHEAHACAKLAQGPLARAVLEVAGPEALFGEVLARDTASKIVWNEEGGRYIGGEAVHTGQVDARMATLYKAGDGRLAVVSMSNTDMYHRVEVFESEHDMVEWSGTSAWLRALCRQAGVDTTVHIE